MNFDFKYIKLALNLFFLALISYMGFALFNAGSFNPVDWYPKSQIYFIVVLICCVLAYMVFSAELPKNKE